MTSEQKAPSGLPAYFSDVKRYKVTEPWIDTKCGLGEAVYWHSPTNTLRFVDIVRKHLYQVDLNAGPSSLKTFELPFPVGSTGEIAGADKDGEFIFGGKNGVGLMDRKTGKWRYIVNYWGEKGDEAKEKKFRGNDGAIDARGRYFIGTMSDPEFGSIENEGTLFRVDPDLSIHTIKHPVKIPNGISWTLDNKFIYITESTDNAITKYPYDIETGAVDFANGELFWGAPRPNGGDPDGHAQDAEGHFWVALYGAGQVVRVSPQGQIVAVVELPTRSVTCPGIAGEDLYITTAAEEDPDKYPESAKYQGAVFKVHIGVKGAPLNQFRMEKKV